MFVFDRKNGGEFTRERRNQNSKSAKNIQAKSSDLTPLGFLVISVLHGGIEVESDYL